MLYFIRHAESSFNYQADHKLRQQMGNQYSKSSPEYLKLKFDPRFADCSLTQKGREQCLMAKQKMKNIDVGLVLVSPMRRTLETCAIVFEGHESKPKIVVEPAVREIFSSSCDIGSRLRESMKDFEGWFNFAKVGDPDYWYINSIKNQKVRDELLQKMHKEVAEQQSSYKQQQKSQQKPRQKQPKSQHIPPQNHSHPQKPNLSLIAFNTMLAYLKQNYKSINQNSFSNFQAQKQQFKQLLKQYKNIAIVSHHDNIVQYTGRKVGNCQVIQVNGNQL